MPNSVTEDPTYPVPLLREMLSRLVGKKIFSELDLVDAYHQIALDEESMECTTFTIPGVGKAYWVVLFFGAKGAVAFFQKIIKGALGEISVDIDGPGLLPYPSLSVSPLFSPLLP